VRRYAGKGILLPSPIAVNGLPLSIDIGPIPGGEVERMITFSLTENYPSNNSSVILKFSFSGGEYARYIRVPIH